ncbi:hypothetical protein DFH07DRAFT_935054 [Mycena maculata]|uniref:BAR-domain-containing protein n=1 Tax=Mycena maculata TaxID=230809 RepID=A0AAD7KH17_9AGAR|nr:hypothetical protein DFH07DRAFT_935054 [Mycena maculata]
MHPHFPAPLTHHNMAGKQLGKLRQWAGEVISSRDKTSVSDEFKELERDVDLRRDGAQRLFMASEAYHKHLAKKKDNAALDDPEKLLPLDTLGIVMIIHGEEFGSDSPFGNSLVTLGRAHCKVAKLQEAFAQAFHDGFVASLVRFADDIKDYEALRRKLESRRLSYDAAVAKNDKTKSSKKERERRDAEEDMQIAKQRYDETAEELEAHMHAIQENEIVQLRELTGLLTLELGFVEQHLDVLRETRASWPSDSSPPERHAFPAQAPRFGSVRSQRSAPPESSEDEDAGGGARARSTSRPPSRPASRASRKRTDSTGTAGGASEKDAKDKDREREREKGRRRSVAGWVGSVTGRGKRKEKEFASLHDREEGAGSGESDGGGGSAGASGGGGGLVHALTRRASKPKTNGGQTTPKLPARILKPPSQEQEQRKRVRALYDFSGSADELAFKAGDTIAVVSEVLDGWWMGELHGRQGLFPTPYTEALPARPPLPSRPGAEESDDSRGYGAEETEDEDGHAHYGRPLAAAGAGGGSPFYSGLPGGDADAASVVSSVADEDDDGRGLMPSIARVGALQRPVAPRRATTTELQGHAKKAPPPPPPRRATNSATASPRPGPPSRPQSAAGRPGYLSSSASESSHSYDRSPFESAMELASPVGEGGGCGDFKQNPFKMKGMCSNCFELHG